MKRGMDLSGLNIYEITYNMKNLWPHNFKFACKKSVSNDNANFKFASQKSTS